jgi:hypothetical protein
MSYQKYTAFGGLQKLLTPSKYATRRILIMLGRSRARTFVVQHILAAAVLALFVPVVAHAGSISYTNKGGTTSCTLAGVTGTTCTVMGATDEFGLKNSGITTINGIAATGYRLSLTTFGAFTGSLSYGGTWNLGGTGTGGNFTISQPGTGNLGVIFSGSFTGAISWTLDSPVNCSNCQYTLKGDLTGMYYPSGQASGGGFEIISGTTSQLTLTTGKNGGLYTGANGISLTSGSSTLVTPVPEPRSLGLMGTGLVGIGYIVRRKVRAAGQVL